VTSFIIIISSIRETKTRMHEAAEYLCSIVIVGELVSFAKGIIVSLSRMVSLIVLRVMTWEKNISPKINVTTAWKISILFVHLMGLNSFQLFKQFASKNSPLR